MELGGHAQFTLLRCGELWASDAIQLVSHRSDFSKQPHQILALNCVSAPVSNEQLLTLRRCDPRSMGKVIATKVPAVPFVYRSDSSDQGNQLAGEACTQHGRCFRLNLPAAIFDTKAIGPVLIVY